MLYFQMRILSLRVSFFELTCYCQTHFYMFNNLWRIVIHYINHAFTHLETVKLLNSVIAFFWWFSASRHGIKTLSQLIFFLNLAEVELLLNPEEKAILQQNEAPNLGKISSVKFLSYWSMSFVFRLWTLQC